MERLGIPKLNNQNYGSWKFTVELLLVREDLWKYVNPGNPPVAIAAAGGIAGNAAEVAAWGAGDQRARATIGLLVEETQHALIRNTTTAKEAWESLQKHHEKVTLSAKVGIFYRLCDMRYTDGEDIEQHLYEMEQLFEKLSKAGTNLGRELEVMMVLRSLPKSFSTLTTALDCRKEEEITLELVKQKVMDEVMKRKGDEKSEKALRVKEKAPNKKSVVCHNCQKVGHKKKDCRVKPKSNEVNRDESKASRSAQAKVATYTKEEEEVFAFAVGADSVNEWTIDSGSSWHICANRHYFDCIEKRNLETPREVIVADGKKCPVEGEGTCRISCSVQGQGAKQMVLSRVLYVPEINANLVSVGCLVRKGAEVSFSASGCTISCKGRTAGEAVLEGGLYLLKTVQEPIASVAKSHNPFCIHEWHRRLGHRDPEAILELDRSGLASGFRIHPCGIRAVCECCLKGKMARLPFPKQAEQKSTAVLDLIHSDVCGPMNTPTPGGCRYFVTFIDDYSRYSWIFFLRKKSEVEECFKRFVSMAKTQFGKTVKVLRSDQGGEYKSGSLESFCSQEGILQQYTTAYTPQQNGVSERKNRSLVEMGRCMLLDANMGYRYWAEAVNTANYLQNMLPTRVRKKTPYEILFKEKPDFQNLHVFGSQACVYVPSEKRTKLEPKSVRMTFVGYSSQHKGFRMIDLETDKVIVSRDVRFLKQEELEIFRPTGPASKESVVEFPLAVKPEVPEKDCENESVVSEYEDADEEDFLGFSASSIFHGEEQEVPDDPPNVEVRRSRRSNFGIPPQRYQVNGPVRELPDEPRSYKEAVNGPESDKWKQAICNELKSQRENQTWEEAELPPGRKVVGCRWVFKRKYDEDGNVIQYKARLVAQGFNQVYGVDFDEIFAPVAKQVTFRTLLTIAARRGMLVKHLDVKTAYLNADLDEEIFMRMPPGVTPTKSSSVLLMKKSIYGLRQSARMWNRKIDGVLRQMGFKPSSADPCLYVRHRGQTSAFILLYVDDMLVACSNQQEYEEIFKRLQGHFDLTQLGDVQHFVGIQVEKQGKHYYLSQKAYIRKLADRFGMTEAKTSKIPMDTGYVQQKEESERLPTNENFQSLIGGLLYLAVHSRPDIAISTSILGRKVSQPTAADWVEAKRVLRYLIGTCDLKLCIGGEGELEGFADADWAGNAHDRKSNSGYMFRLGDGTISWTARKQTCVALSSTEAEYISLSECCQDLQWILKLMKDFGEDVKQPVKINEDNQSCIKLLKQDGGTKRSKHVDTRYHFVRDMAEQKRINVVYCPSSDMLADALTKPLARIKLEELREKIGLRMTR